MVRDTFSVSPRSRERSLSSPAHPSPSAAASARQTAAAAGSGNAALGACPAPPWRKARPKRGICLSRVCLAPSFMDLRSSDSFLTCKRSSPASPLPSPSPFPSLHSRTSHAGGRPFLISPLSLSLSLSLSLPRGRTCDVPPHAREVLRGDAHAVGQRRHLHLGRPAGGRRRRRRRRGRLAQASLGHRALRAARDRQRPSRSHTRSHAGACPALQLRPKPESGREREGEGEGRRKVEEKRG